jgi:alpha-tubulin suppressor-like RCC1 family protein
MELARTDGTLWSWGNNDYGQRGDGTRDASLVPYQIGDGTSWVSVSAGRLHTVALRSDGTLWAWGDNSRGQLGDGTFELRANPVQVGTSLWTAVAAGEAHTLAVRSDGTLWAWGEADRGALGIPGGPGWLPDAPSPTQVGTERGWIAVSAGSDHSAAMKGDGTLWTWGGNTFGQLGLGISTTSGFARSPTATGHELVEVAAGRFHGAGIAPDGTLWTWGANDWGQLGVGFAPESADPVQVGTASGWTKVAAGSSHTIALRSDGTLWGWGSNLWGQLGADAATEYEPVQIGTGTGWTAIAAGDSHTVALRDDHTIWATGLNTEGQIGSGDSSYYVFGPVQVGTLTGWTAIAAGKVHTLALREDGSMWAWGGNGDGQLGDGTVHRQVTPVQVATPIQMGEPMTWSRVFGGHLRSFAIRSDGTLWGWGEYPLGDPYATSHELDPIQIGTATDWSEIASGNMHVLGRRGGTLWAWGAQNFMDPALGQPIWYGNGYEPIRLGTATDWTRIAAGENFGLGISGGVLQSWGDSYFGQCGNGFAGKANERWFPTQVP